MSYSCLYLQVKICMRINISVQKDVIIMMIFWTCICKQIVWIINVYIQGMLGSLTNEGEIAAINLIYF